MRDLEDIAHRLDAHRQAKSAGIVTSLPPQQHPAATKPRKLPRTPAVVRFLRKHCPPTVDEFVERFGEPHMDMAGEAAKEYSVWTVDGNPVLTVDYA